MMNILNMFGNKLMSDSYVLFFVSSSFLLLLHVSIKVLVI